MTPMQHALNDLVWATFGFRNLVTGESRAKFLAIWNAASHALCRGVFKADEAPLEDARGEAVKLHRRCLDICAALGVKPHELVPQFNERADAGFPAQGDPADRVILLALDATRVARALTSAREKKEDADAGAD